MLEEFRGGVVSAERLSASVRAVLNATTIASVAVMLAGCNMSSGAGQQPVLGQTTGYVGSAPDIRTEMFNLGVDYGSAVSFGDTAHVTDLVSSCYVQWEQTTAPNENTLGTAYTQYVLHRCLELDYLAYKDNQALTNQGLSGNPYFTRDAFDGRLGRYGIPAGFTNPNDVFPWLRSGYAFARPAANEAIRHHQGFHFGAPQPITGVFGGGS